MKRLLITLMLMASAIAFASCNSNKNSASGASPQLTKPAKGEEIAVMETSMGKIKLKFFPEYAPKAVENFKTHAKNGYYDGVIFHRVISEFMIQTGDPTGTGQGGESIWGEPFGVEPASELHHIRGAIGTAKTMEPISIGSQFYIVQNSALDAESVSEFESMLASHDQVVGKDEGGNDVKISDIYPVDIMESYIKNGGTPWLDFEYTVFAQVIDGMDVVDKIARVKTSSNSATMDKPVEDVWIVGISFEKY